jgi:phytoene synthase
MQSFGVQREPLDALLDGMFMDVEPHDFGDEAELRTYCERVASAVGRACLPVLGARGDAATAFADSLGRALQLTNILRDLREDARAGRTYVPRTWLAESGVERGWLRGDGPDVVYARGGPVARLCSRIASEANREFEAARGELRRMDRRSRRALVPARIMGAVYGELLRRLEAAGGDIRGPVVRVPRRCKLWLAIGAWAGVRS